MGEFEGLRRLVVGVKPVVIMVNACELEIMMCRCPQGLCTPKKGLVSEQVDNKAVIL